MTITEIRDAHAGCLIERRWADRDAALILEAQQMVTNLQTFLLGQRKLANLECTKDALMRLLDHLDNARADSIDYVAREFDEHEAVR